MVNNQRIFIQKNVTGSRMELRNWKIYMCLQCFTLFFCKQEFIMFHELNPWGQCNGSECHLQCQHSVWALIWALIAALLIQVPGNAPRIVAENGSNMWAHGPVWKSRCSQLFVSVWTGLDLIAIGKWMSEWQLCFSSPFSL